MKVLFSWDWKCFMFFLGCETFSDLKEGYFFINRKLFWFGKVFQYTWKWGKYFLEYVLHWIKRGQRFNDQTNPKGHLKEKGKRNKLKKEKKTQCNINIMNFLSYFMNILLPSQSLYSIQNKRKKISELVFCLSNKD